MSLLDKLGLRRKDLRTDVSEVLQPNVVSSNVLRPHVRINPLPFRAARYVERRRTGNDEFYIASASTGLAYARETWIDEAVNLAQELKELTKDVSIAVYHEAEELAKKAYFKTKGYLGKK